MPEPKKPQDHKKKVDPAPVAEAVDEPTTVEYGGITYTLVDSPGGDVELMEALAELDAGNQLVMPRIVRALIGAKQYDAFKAAHRNPDTGIVPMTALRELFTTIDGSLGE